MDKVLIFLILIDLMFVGTGGVMVGLSIKVRNEMARGPTLANVAGNLLLMHTPLNGGCHSTQLLRRFLRHEIDTDTILGAIANGGLVFFTFLISLPAIALQTTRGFLKAYGWLVIASATFTLAIGLNIWFSTLKTRSHLQTYWAEESSATQSLLQQRVCNISPD